jgi:hypothetical protein
MTIHLGGSTNDQDYARIANAVWAVVRAMAPSDTEYYMNLDRQSSVRDANEEWDEQYRNAERWGEDSVVEDEDDS